MTMHMGDQSSDTARLSQVDTNDPKRGVRYNTGIRSRDKERRVLALDKCISPVVCD